MPEHKTVYAALLAAQQEMGPIHKTSTNPAFRSKYADLGAVIEVITDTLTKNGLLFLQPLGIEDGQQVLRTIIKHPSSDTQIESTAILVCKDPTNPQAIGGAITYFRRYSLLSLLGLAPEDDDGQRASTAPKPPPRRNDDPVDFASTRGKRDDADEPEEMTSWTEFWSWARANNFQTKAAIEHAIGGLMDGRNPQQVKDALTVSMKVS